MPRILEMDEPFDYLKGLSEAGDYHSLVREYVELSYHVGSGKGTPGDRKALEDFEEYVQEPMGADTREERETPKRGREFLTRFLEEMALYRTELLVQCGRDALDIENGIRNGFTPGADLYVGNEEAMRDMADCRMNGTERFAKTVITSAGMKLVSMSYTDVPVTDDVADRLGYEHLTMGDFIKDPMYAMISDYAKQLDPRYGTMLRERGESLVSDATLSQKYGLKVNRSGFEEAVDEDGKSQTLDLADARNQRSTKAFNDYSESLDGVIAAAKQQLAVLREMEAKKSSNSNEFTAMVDALRDVAEMYTNLSTPKQIESALNTLKEATKDYMERIDGNIFRGRSADGKARREIAGTLSDLADSWSDGLKKAADGRLNEYQPLGRQKEGLEKNRQYIDDARAKAPAATEIVSPVAESETIINKPVTKAQTIVRPERGRSVNLATLMRDQKAAEGKPAAENSVRAEVLRKREEIMQKRRQNEAAGIVNDGKNQAKKPAGKGGM